MRKRSKRIASIASFITMWIAVTYTVYFTIRVAWIIYLDADWLPEQSFGIDITPIIIAGVVAIVFLCIYLSFKRKKHVF